MNNNILEYKGYHAKVEFDAEALILRGKIEGINDLVNFESADINEIRKEFESAVDDYLEFCKEVGKDPDKEYKGSFNVRVNPELHRRLANYAFSAPEQFDPTLSEARPFNADKQDKCKKVQFYFCLQIEIP